MLFYYSNSKSAAVELTINQRLRYICIHLSEYSVTWGTSYQKLKPFTVFYYSIH